MISGAAVYKAFGLGWQGVFLSLILSGALFAGLLLATKKENSHDATQTNNIPIGKWTKTLAIAYLVFIAAVFYLFFQARTSVSLISPWEVVSPLIFAAYGLASLILLCLIRKAPARRWLPLLSLHYLATFAGALLVYRIGFGFDPFIHEATLKLIDAHGVVEPVPWYYIGQYALIIIIHKITFLPIEWLNSALVPILASLAIPFGFVFSLGRFFKDQPRAYLITLILLILPYSFFIMTTPQNLAYLLLLLALAYGLACQNMRDLILVYALALASLSCQPIAGLPAIFFAFALTIFHSDIGRRTKSAFYILISLGTAVSLPAAFFWTELSLSGQTAKTPAGFDWHAILKNLKWPQMPAQQTLGDLIYLYGYNLGFVTAFLALAGFIIIYWSKPRKTIYQVYLLIAGSLLVAYTATQALPFSYLVNYERSAYADRLLLVISFFLLPFLTVCFYAFLKALTKTNKSAAAIFMAFLACLLTISFYLAYPRQDDHYNSRFYSVGQHDLDAVDWIEKEAEDSYVVLANQQIGAAALGRFGFSRYYAPNCQALSESTDTVLSECPENEIFYYPIPTGGPLYQYYLAMVYDYPARATAREAARLTGVSEVYLVINDYWWAAGRLRPEASSEADSELEFGQGAVSVYKYKFNTPNVLDKKQ
jgi:hypothetical protein